MALFPHSPELCVSYFVSDIWFCLELIESEPAILAQSDQDCQLFCVHIYNKPNSLCIYSTYTVREHHFIIYCSLFLWKGSHLFLILLHLISLAHRGQTTATETLMDQLDWNVPGFPFSWEAEEWKKHKDEEFIANFLPFISTILLLFCQMMFVWFLQPNLFLFIHSTLRVKIIPRNLKEKKIL